MSMILKTEKVIKEWTDYNGHMNLSYYILIFDNAAEVMLTKFKMGGDSAQNDKKSTFAVETHTTYDQEVKLGEEVDVHLTYLDHDKKRIHYRVSMFHKEKNIWLRQLRYCHYILILIKERLLNLSQKRLKLWMILLRPIPQNLIQKN